MKDSIKEIQTAELISFIGKPNAHIIDIRPVEAYNGWILQGEQRGGHIKGARSLPIKWITYMDWIEMVRHKDILPENPVIIYSYSTFNTQKVAELFLKAGYADVSVYNRFQEEWSANPSLPMEQLAHFPNLVSAQWIKKLIFGENPEHFFNEKFVIVHAHYRNRNAYLSGHIPGAIDMDTLALESPETWNRRTPEELKSALEEHGITSETTVVLYGKYMDPNNNDPFPGSAAGDIAAIRCAFIMMYAGVKDVRILNGGFQAWMDAGYFISQEDLKKRKADNFGCEIPVNPELAVDTPQAKYMLASPDSELVCVRSYPEYLGEVSGYNYIEEKGRIPGAIFADCGSDAYHMENYRNFDHTTREYHEIEANWRKNGITPDLHLAFYCGTGWRGSEAWFNAWLMGWPRVSVYDGGWYEWSSDKENPVESGVPRKELSLVNR